MRPSFTVTPVVGTPQTPAAVDVRLTSAASPEESLKTVLEAAATALGPNRFEEAATALVTALANRFACDRISLGMLIHGTLHVRALSHSAQFSKKADLLRTIASAMEEAVDQRSAVIIPVPSDSPSRITRAHEDLARRYGASAIYSVPLWSQQRIIGVLTFERGGDEAFDKQTLDVYEAIASLAGPILDLKYRDDRWLLVKAWDAARHQLAHVFGAGHLALKLTVLVVAAVAAFFFFATGAFRISAKALLEGEVQQAAVAPFQGYLETAPVRAGDVVEAGQVLATLQDRDLKVERLKHLNEQAQLNKEYRKALAERDAPKTQILTAQLGQVEAQLALATEKLRRTRLTAPFSGIVVTGDLSQKLGSPVKEGDVLFEIAPLDSYRIVLDVDERDIAYVSVGQAGNLLLSSLSQERFPFEVVKMTPVSTAREGRNFFRVEGRFTTTDPQLRPAMEGIGKIDIDQRRLAWIWTHEVIDWLRLKLWAWLP
jgi:multidrug resistance efflux pump